MKKPDCEYTASNRKIKQRPIEIDKGHQNQ